MIVAVGTDAIEVERIRRAIEDPRTGKRFRERVYTPGEIDYCSRRKRWAQSFAARFAAKEAVMKVLGRGFEGGIAWRDIEVVRTEGRPTIALHGEALTLARNLGVTHWHLALTHTGSTAVAFVVAEKFDG